MDLGGIRYLSAPYTKGQLMPQMIRVVRTRKTGDKVISLPEIDCESSSEAIRHMKDELLAGGIVTEQAGRHHKILVHTKLENGGHDVSEYRGPDVLLKPLHDFIYFNLQYTGKKMHFVEGQGNVHIDPRMDHIHPEIEPLLMGDGRMKIAMIIACGFRKPEEIRELAVRRCRDIVAYRELMVAGECSSPSEAFAS